MRSLRFEGGGVARLVEAPDPVPGPGEVVVRTMVSALCGSELHAYRGEGLPHGNNGHEAAGVVEAVGDGVMGVSVGQRVGVSAIAGCGNCDFCARGQFTWCPSFRFYGSMHAEKFLAAANACHPLPDDVSWEAGVLLSGDGLGVPFHTATKIDSDEIQTVAIFGVGPVGQGNVLMQANWGRRVIAVDLSAARRERARRLGAAEMVDPAASDAAGQVRTLTGGLGADVCIEAAGRPETALACFAAVRTGGTVLFNGEQEALPLSPSEHFIRRDITAIGSWFYHFGEFDAMLALYRAGLPLTDLISHQVPFAQAPEAWAIFAAGDSGKVLLSYEA